LLGDNNGVAVGMLMLVPLLLSLARTGKSRTERFMHRFLAVGVLYRAISTYSRGGFLSAGMLGLHFLGRSKHKVASVVGVALVVALIMPALPPAFWDRMGTIQSAAQDVESSDFSTASRVHFWNVAVKMALANPLTGVGHNAFNVFFDRYDFLHGEYGKGRSVHNSFLGTLAELGFPGFTIFLLLIAFGLRACWRARRLSKRDPAFERFGHYATAIEGSLLIFTVGGSFVPWQYCEMLWHTLALSVVLNHLVTEQEATVPVPALASPVAAAIALRAVAHSRNQARA
jgi:probable O-glycosylation ligase (exosortase A-associated)